MLDGELVPHDGFMAALHIISRDPAYKDLDADAAAAKAGAIAAQLVEGFCSERQAIRAKKPAAGNTQPPAAKVAK